MQHASQTLEKEQEHTRCRSGTTTREHLEHEENQVQDEGGQGSAGREDKKKAGATSGLSKDNTVNRHTQRLP